MQRFCIFNNKDTYALFKRGGCGRFFSVLSEKALQQVTYRIAML